jgi:hypothetical protein
MSETSTLIGYNGRLIGHEELALVPTPPATETHHPIPCHEIVRALIETLGFPAHWSCSRRVRSLAKQHKDVWCHLPRN